MRFTFFLLLSLLFIFQSSECTAQTRENTPLKNDSFDKAEQDSVTNKNYRISTRLGLSTFRRLSAQFEKRIDATKGAYFNGSYVFGWSGMQSNGGLFCGNVGLQEFYSLSGFGTEVGIALREPEDNLSGRTQIFSFEYRYVTGTDVEDDEGCFGGTSETQYALYDLRAHQFALLYTFEKAGKKAKSPNFYITAGMGMQNKTKAYQIEGRSFSTRGSSNRVGMESTPFLRFDLGVRL